MGSYIHAIDRELKTPMMYAAENDHKAIVKYLLKCKANIKQRVSKRITVWVQYLCVYDPYWIRIIS